MAARVTCYRRGHPLGMLDPRLHAPKTSPSQNHLLLTFGARKRLIGRRFGKGELRLDRSRSNGAHGGPGNESNDQRDGDASTDKWAAHLQSPMSVRNKGYVWDAPLDAFRNIAVTREIAMRENKRA